MSKIEIPCARTRNTAWVTLEDETLYVTQAGYGSYGIVLDKRNIAVLRDALGVLAARLARGSCPCFYCDKEVDQAKPHWRIHLCTDGTTISADVPNPEAYDSQGTFPVCTDCSLKDPNVYQDHP